MIENELIDYQDVQLFNCVPASAVKEEPGRLAEGSVRDVDTNSPAIRNAVYFATRELNRRRNNVFLTVPTNVISATGQVCTINL